MCWGCTMTCHMSEFLPHLTVRCFVVTSLLCVARKPETSLWTERFCVLADCSDPWSHLLRAQLWHPSQQSWGRFHPQVCSTRKDAHWRWYLHSTKTTDASPTSCFPCPSLSSGAAPELLRSHKLPEGAENGMPKPKVSPRLAASG